MASSSSDVLALVDTEGRRFDGPYIKNSTEWFHPYARSSAEQKPRPAPSTKEAGDSAAWRLYNKAAKEVDEKLVKDWNSKLGGILLFAALFAAVVVTLLVDTMTLLEPSPLDRTEDLLYFLAMQTIHHVDQLPPQVEPAYRDTYVYTRPHWAFVINGLLVSSLSFSVLVALGAVVCLEWVNEYEARSRALSTPEKQALRRHYRFRAVRKWHMARLIGALPFMMFLVVVLFFVALIMWLWRIDRFLALLPVLGVSITGAAHLLTTALAVSFPSSPFKTSISEAIFRIFTVCDLLFTFLYTVLPIWFKFGVKRLKVRLSGQSTDASRSSYGMSWANAMDTWNDRIHKAHPWLPRSLQLTDAITMSRREDEAVKTDGTLQLSALSWLAGSLDFTPDSYEELVDILREINKLNESQLQGWGAFEYEAPWNDMFRVVLSCSQVDTVASEEQAEMENILSSLLQKMLVNQPLFSRVVKDIDHPSIINAFLESLATAEPTNQPETRLRGMAIILSSMDSGKHHRTKWHYRAIFKILSDNMQMRGERMDSDFTSWIFPLCGHNGRRCDDHDPNWPDPIYIDFTETFTWRKCRVDAIFRFMELIDRIEQDEDISAEDIRRMFGLLINHILAIHWAFEAPAFVIRVEMPLRLGSHGFNNPALDLIASTMTRPAVYVPWPSEPLSAQWHYAVTYWCRWKRQVRSGFSTEEGHAELDFLCRIWEQTEESLFAESMDMLEGNASILLPREWTLIFETLTKTASLMPQRVTRILVLFERALQALTEQGPSFRAFLKSHMQPSGQRVRPAEYNPLLPSPTSPATPRKRWSGSGHRYPPRYNSGNDPLNDPSFRLSSLLQFIIQSLGDHRPDDSEQRSLRAVSARIVASIVNLMDRLEPDEVTLLGDFQNYLQTSDPQRGDPVVQHCIGEIRSKLGSLVDSDGAITLGRQGSARSSYKVGLGKVRGRQAAHTLPVVPEVHALVPRSTEVHETNQVHINESFGQEISE